MVLLAMDSLDTARVFRGYPHSPNLKRTKIADADIYIAIRNELWLKQMSKLNRAPDISDKWNWVRGQPDTKLYDAVTANLFWGTAYTSPARILRAGLLLRLNAKRNVCRKTAYGELKQYMPLSSILKYRS